MTDDTFRTIADPAEGLYKEKGSKFMAFAYPVSTTDEVKTLLDQLRKQYFDARHHCYAYILGPHKETCRLNDDGEPSGTGGRPIHGQLLSADLTDTLIVVVRYFGGVLLGASGLACAYRAAARDAIANATVVERTIDRHLRLQFPYEAMNDVMRLLKNYALKPANPVYAQQCSMEIFIRQSLSSRLLDDLALLRTVQTEPLD